MIFSFTFCQIHMSHFDQIVPPRVKRGGDSAVVLWQALSSAMIAWVLPEVLVFLVWEYSFSFIPQGILSISFLFTFRQDVSCGALVSGDQILGNSSSQLQSQRLTSAYLCSITYGMAIVGDRLWIADTHNHRIQIVA
jgi:hypothetical protein